MRRARVKTGLAATAVAALGVGTVAVATDGSGVRERLTGFEEVPALSTPGSGTFRATLDRDAGEIRYRLAYGDLESPVTQAHIHFENETNNGPIVVFLCSNLPNAPAGTQACPPNGGAVTGTITADDVGAGAEAQGLAAGELDELVRAIDAKATYVNVHSEARPAGEVRAQLEPGEDDDGAGDGGHDHDDD